MSKDTHSQKTFILISLFLLLISVSFCLVVSILAGYSIADAQQLTLFRQQLLLSTLGIYCVFCGIYFLYQRKPSDKKPTIPTKPITKVATPSAPLRILAVDDNTANLLVIENHLATQNISVILASSGIEALTIVESKAVDLIFMDIEMHGMDGIQTTQAIRSQESIRTPIVAVSAHTENQKQLEILAAGFDGYLSKPISTDTLLATVNRWCHTEKGHHDSSTMASTAIPVTSIAFDSTNLNTSNINTPIAEPSSPIKQSILTNIRQKKTHPPANTVKKVIDIKKSLEHSNHNNALAKDMLDLLIKMIKCEKIHITRFHQAQDWDSLYKLNHKIYGGSSYCGVPALQLANQQLEKLLQPTLYFGEDTSDEDQYENDILTALDSGTQIQKIDQAIEYLLSAINDIILWDEEYDTAIVFDVESA